MKLTAVILTYNETEHIRDCIESVRFADHVLVFDSFSTDATPMMAEQAGAEVIQHPFENYASQRNAALRAVQGRTDWLLFVDADERVTPELAAEIRGVLDRPAFAGWRIPRHNFIFGRLTRGAGWYPDYQTRLLRVGYAEYDPARQVHELVILKGDEGTLEHPLTHYNYRTLEQFHRKQRAYSTYDARILYEQGVRVKPHNYLLQPWRQFWWRFRTLKGYQDGWHGLRLSILMAWYELRKYRELAAMWWRGSSEATPPVKS
jgi:glycosyltransferase involved in cell wall biosynthesis